MKKYDDFKKDKKERDLTEDEIKSIDWTKYKIVVPTKKDKLELMSAFEHIHYSDIDTDFITVNQLAHEYLNGDNILISEKLFNILNNKDKGFVYAPFIIGKPEQIDINGEVVWYRNKMKNLLLKIKRFFYKSKNVKHAEKYLNKKLNSSFYGVVKIDSDENR